MTKLAQAVERIDPFRVRIKPWREQMRVEGRVYADEQLWPAILADLTAEQVANVATLPGIVGASLAMPDAHQGYGFPIGGVAATDVDAGGVISPGGVGFDINCGVRLLATELEAADLGLSRKLKGKGKKAPSAKLAALADELFRRVPVGYGKGRGSASVAEIDAVLAQGAAWAVREGMGTEADLAHTEEGGCHRAARPDAVSHKAKERGVSQVGSLGAGNHFVEVQVVSRVLDANAARVYGLAEGQIAVLLHTGSRGLGHQVCTDHVHALGRALARYGYSPPDRQLAAVPVDSEEGSAYLAAMAAAANFAWANRQVLTWQIRQALDAVFGRGTAARLVYDVAHNLAKIEEHEVGGQARRLCVHRKGATRAFGPGRREVPEAYRTTGQPVLIPGSMGTASYVLAGTDQAMAESWGSCCHGAGRAMSRSAAKRRTDAKEVLADLERRGVLVRAGSRAGLVEEFPGAYKDVSNVVNVVSGAGLARPVAKLVPLAVVKG